MYVGNFAAPHSTENHVAGALEAVGHEVGRVQEQQADWATLAARVPADAGLVLWTHTRDYAPPPTFEAQRRFLDACPVPVVGYHLDLWWGLRRERLVGEEPFFRVDLLVTADGGHPEEWEAAGVVHRWLPPAVSAAECAPGTPRDEFRSPVVFVGSHQGGYHPESRHRGRLLRELRRRADVAFWPRPGQPALRGAPLRDLYASAGMAVGDSAMVGDGPGFYWSDRIPECVGRGCLLLHPWVPGLDGYFEDGKHLVTWTAGDWGRLHDLIEDFKANPEAAADIAAAGRAHVLATATYEVRMGQLFDLVAEEGLL